MRTKPHTNKKRHHQYNNTSTTNRLYTKLPRLKPPKQYTSLRQRLKRLPQCNLTRRNKGLTNTTHLTRTTKHQPQRSTRNNNQLNKHKRRKPSRGILYHPRQVSKTTTSRQHYQTNNITIIYRCTPTRNHTRLTTPQHDTHRTNTNRLPNPYNRFSSHISSLPKGCTTFHTFTNILSTKREKCHNEGNPNGT